MSDKCFLGYKYIGVCFIEGETIKLCIDIKERYGFSYWDSLVIATAIENECSIIYSEDMKHDQIISGSVKIVNPFLKDQIC